MANKNMVITINRMYGSGGRTVAKMLSEKLNIPYYDKDLIKLASEESGINESLFANADEKVPSTTLFKIAKKLRREEVVSPDSKDFTSIENLFNYQAKIIKQLAETESCVIVGRCSNYILKDYDNVLSVFIHAPHEYCLERAAEIKNLSFEELEAFVIKTNKQKETYYKYFTGQDWSNAMNYDLCLNSSKLGYDRCVEEIIAYKNVRFGV